MRFNRKLKFFRKLQKKNPDAFPPKRKSTRSHARGPRLRMNERGRVCFPVTMYFRIKRSELSPVKIDWKSSTHSPVTPITIANKHRISLIRATKSIPAPYPGPTTDASIDGFSFLIFFPKWICSFKCQKTVSRITRKKTIFNLNYLSVK